MTERGAMHSKRLTAAERRTLRSLLFAELEGRSARISWSSPVRYLGFRGMVKPAPGSFETASGGRAILYELTPRGRACARQLWWTRIHPAARARRGAFSSKTYNPLADTTDLFLLRG